MLSIVFEWFSFFFPSHLTWPGLVWYLTWPWYGIDMSGVFRAEWCGVDVVY